MESNNWNYSGLTFRTICGPRLMLSLALVLTISAGSRCSAQAPETHAGDRARIVESLSDGGYVIEINGVKFRAITDDQLREIGARKLELNSCTQERSLLESETGKLRTALVLAQKDAQLAEAQAAIQRERTGRFQALFEGEQALRLQAEHLVRRGRVSRFFDNPWVQVAIKVGLPAIAAAVRR